MHLVRAFASVFVSIFVSVFVSVFAFDDFQAMSCLVDSGQSTVHFLPVSSTFWIRVNHCWPAVFNNGSHEGIFRVSID